MFVTATMGRERTPHWYMASQRSLLFMEERPERKRSRAMMISPKKSSMRLQPSGKTAMQDPMTASRPSSSRLRAEPSFFSTAKVRSTRRSRDLGSSLLTGMCRFLAAPINSIRKVSRQESQFPRPSLATRRLETSGRRASLTMSSQPEGHPFSSSHEPPSRTERQLPSRLARALAGESFCIMC